MAAKKAKAKKAKKGKKRAVDFSGKNVAEFRNALSANLIKPLELVMLTRERIEEALDDAVKRGRMTRTDATELATSLYSRGRQQTEDLLKDLEQLMGRGSVSKALKAADPLLAKADQARRTTGVGPTFPITGYDSLTAAQVKARLGTLTPAELRKVRDYEKRRANRKSLATAIEKVLRTKD
jgi:polyhydroxyalkanoate synthesis regulator phasin